MEQEKVFALSKKQMEMTMQDGFNKKNLAKVDPPKVQGLVDEYTGSEVVQEDRRKKSKQRKRSSSSSLSLEELPQPRKANHHSSKSPNRQENPTRKEKHRKEERKERHAQKVDMREEIVDEPIDE